MGMEKIMPKVTRKTCPVCNHEERDIIEQGVLDGSIDPSVLDKDNGWWNGTTRKHMQNHTDNYVSHSNDNCKLCTHQSRADIEAGLSDGRTKVSEIAEQLEMSEDAVQLHLRKHLKPMIQKSAAMELARIDFNEMDVLSNNIAILQNKVNGLADNENLNFKEIDSLTRLAKEIRESLKYMLEFKGQLVHKREETIVIQQVEVIQKILIEKYPEVWTEIRDNVAERLQ